MNILFIGGTGKVSLPCAELALKAGHKVAVFNRGQRLDTLPAGVRSIVGDQQDRASYGRLGERHWDVVAQFIAYTARPDAAGFDVFTGKTGQYIFISSASVYQRSIHDYVTTEARTPAINPYWPYSQAKIACETLMKGSKLPGPMCAPARPSAPRCPRCSTRVMPSPTACPSGKPVLVTGDGNSLWTLTRRGFRQTLRRAVRQAGGAARGLPHHRRCRLHLGRDLSHLCQGARRGRQYRARPHRHGDPLQA